MTKTPTSSRRSQVGDWFRAARAHTNRMKQAELAELLQCSQSTVQSMESGTRRVSGPTLTAIRDAISQGKLKADYEALEAAIRSARVETLAESPSHQTTSWLLSQLSGLDAFWIEQYESRVQEQVENQDRPILWNLASEILRTALTIVLDPRTASDDLDEEDLGGILEHLKRWHKQLYKLSKAQSIISWRDTHWRDESGECLRERCGQMWQELLAVCRSCFEGELGDSDRWSSVSERLNYTVRELEAERERDHRRRQQRAVQAPRRETPQAGWAVSGEAADDDEIPF